MYKKIIRKTAAVAVLSSTSFFASAAVLTVSGYTSAADGIISAIVPAGSSVVSTAVVDDSAFDDDMVGENDLLSIFVLTGNICIASQDVESHCGADANPNLTVVNPFTNPGFPNSYAQPGSLVDLTSGGDVLIIGELLNIPVPLLLTFGEPLSDQIVNGERVITGTLDFRADPYITHSIEEHANLQAVGWATGTLDYELVGPAVPVPASVWMFGSALVGVCLAQRKKRTN